MEPTIKEKLAYILKHLEPILTFECPYCGCITSERNKIEFETSQGVMRPLLYLKDYLRYLSPNFIQIDRSVIVRASKIVEFDRKNLFITLEGSDKKYSISRREATKLKNFLI